MAEINATRPSGDVVKLTKGTALAKTPTRGLACGTAGTANLVDASGQTLTNFPLQAGYNPIAIVELSSGGTADDIWALY